MDEAGMLVTTIPYDKGFNIKVNGQKVNTEIVNQYFLGAPLAQGTQHVEITFTMTGFYIGMIVTIIGIIITLYLFFRK
jgi:uncharacterized membrane protein YfhO